MYEKTRRLLQETTGCHTAAVPLLLKRISPVRAPGPVRFPSARAGRHAFMASDPGGPISGAGRRRPTRFGVRSLAAAKAARKPCAQGVRTRRSQASSASLRLRRTDPQLSATRVQGLLLLFIAHGRYSVNQKARRLFKRRRAFTTCRGTTLVAADICLQRLPAVPFRTKPGRRRPLMPDHGGWPYRCTGCAGMPRFVPPVRSQASSGVPSAASHRPAAL